MAGLSLQKFFDEVAQVVEVISLIDLEFAEDG